MLISACLLGLLAVYVEVRVLRWVVRALRLDPWETLVFLGLAEYDEPAASRPAQQARALRVARTSHALNT